MADATDAVAKLIAEAKWSVENASGMTLEAEDVKALLALAARVAVLEGALRDAYLAGFCASAEGWNGEFPFAHYEQNPEQDAQWVAKRDAALAKIAANA